MNSKRTASAGTEAAQWTRTRQAALSYVHYTPSGAASQPAWVVSKSAADRAWPGVCDLMQRLGFGTPSATSWVVDARECCDFTTAGGLRWGWRDRAAQYFSFGDCTFRLSRPSGARVECEKLGMIDRCVFTWSTSGRIVEWLTLDAARIVPLLWEPWPVIRMVDAVACCVPWLALARAGAVIDASAGVLAVIRRGAA